TVQFSGDGQHLWTVGPDSTIRQWHGPGGKAGPLLPAGTEIYFAALCPGAKFAALQPVGLAPDTLVFDLATGKKIGRVPGRQTEPWPSMSFARDGKTLALLGSGEGKIELYDLPSIQLRCSMPFEYDLT